MSSLQRTWIVTGASRGLGASLVHAALAGGDNVVATVRGEHSFEPHERLLVHRLDVRDSGGASAAVAAAVESFGGLDVLVNNAGYGLIGAVEEVDETEAREIVDTNLFGPLWLTQAAIPVLRERGGGDIVQISTVGAVGTMPTLGLYNASKWGLEGLSEALAAEVKAFGIRVTIAELGGLDTEWATASMRFAAPLDEYDQLRTDVFGSPTVPWPAEGTGGGTSPDDAAAAILRHVLEGSDDRLRLVVGDDAPGQIEAALQLRRDDYGKDPRFGVG